MGVENKMKTKIIVPILLVFLNVLSGQELTIGTDSYMYIPKGASIHISGLTLEPLADYEIPAETSFTLEDAASQQGNKTTMRQFKFNRLMPKFTGAISFNFDLINREPSNGNKLTLEFLDSSSRWHVLIPESDFLAGSLSYEFMEEVRFSDLAITLSRANSIIDAAKVFPNPTQDEIQIDYPYLSKITLMNSAGMTLETSLNNRINLSTYPAGLYILVIEDFTNNLTTTRQIIKL
jgi:hypothetical protein